MSQVAKPPAFVVDRASSTPAYAQLETALAEEIHTGRWAAGDLLPPIKRLCERYEVAVGTLRQALDSLERDGLIRREQGRGTFVTGGRTTPWLLQSSGGFHEQKSHGDGSSSGFAVTSHVLRAQLEPLPHWAAEMLGLAAGSKGLTVERLRALDGQVALYVINHLPERFADAVFAADLTQESLYACVQQSAGLRIVEGHRSIEAISADERLADLLDCEPSAPLLFIESVSDAHDGQPIDAYRAWLRTDRVRIEVQTGALRPHPLTAQPFHPQRPHRGDAMSDSVPTTRRRLQVVAVGDSFVSANAFGRALEQAAVDAEIRTADVDEEVTWSPSGDDPQLREFAGSPEQVSQLANGADVLFVHVAPVTREVLESLPSLRFLGVARGGPVNIDVAAATALGIPVVTTPGRNATAVSELTVVLAVMMLRRLPQANAFAQESFDLGASAIEGARFVGRELREVNLGLVGFGAVGRGVAELARSFGANVLVHDPFVASDEITAAGCTSRDLDALLAESDVVSLHVRATPETENLADATFLARMRPGAILINTSRETVVDEHALLDALDSDRLVGAALDVVRPSDDVPHPLAVHPKVFALPHVGGATGQAGMNGAMRLAGAVKALLAGDTLPNVVNGIATPRGGRP